MNRQTRIGRWRRSEEKEINKDAVQSRFWGQVPEGWRLVKGYKIYDVNPPYNSRGEKITYIEMDALDTELPFPNYSNYRDPNEHSGRLFREGDILFPRITPCTENGKNALISEINTKTGIGSTEFIVLSPNKERIIPWYLYYLTKSHPIRDYAISRMRGSTGRQRVPYSVFRKELDIILPPLSEQRKIASVLYNVDCAIQKTEEIIEQTKRVKKGIIQDLFTYGIRKHRKLSETSFGKIPDDWTLVNFEEIIEDIRYGTDSKSSKDRSGYPTLRIPNVVKGRLMLGDLKYTDLDEKRAEKLALKNGDILLVRTNGNPNYVGRTTVFNERSVEEKYIFASYLIRIRLKKTDLLPKFVSEFLNSKKGRKEMIGWIRTSAGNYNLGISAINNFKIPLPNVEEQREIISKIDCVNKIIKVNREYKKELIRLKEGLMQDLLTGKVRTADRDIEVLPEVKAHG